MCTLMQLDDACTIVPHQAESEAVVERGEAEKQEPVGGQEEGGRAERSQEGDRSGPPPPGGEPYRFSTLDVLARSCMHFNDHTYTL